MTLDGNILINVLPSANSVRRQSFGRLVIATTEVEVGFTETYRLYQKNSDAAADSDLKAAAKAAVASFFTQALHPTDVAVMKCAALYASLAAELTALALAFPDWYGVTVQSRVEADILAGAAWVAANSPRLGYFQTSDAAVLAQTAGNVAEDLQGLNYDNVALAWHDNDAQNFDVAQMAYKLAADPDQTTTQWAYTPLSGVSVPAVSGFDPADQAVVEAYNANYYSTLRGAPATWPGVTVNGSKIDALISRDWFQARAEESTAQHILNKSAANRKVPFTDKGMRELSGLILAIGRNGESERLGHFRPGSFAVDVPPITDVPPADIAGRIMQVGTAEAILAGSIEKVVWNIAITAS
jgi:hypothetical protein